MSQVSIGCVLIRIHSACSSAQGKGSGKSFAVGKDLMVRKYLAGEGQVLIEPTGGTCDYFLDKIQRVAAQLSPEARKAFLSRIVYQDMAATTQRAPSCPLYYRLHPSETLSTIAERPLDIWLKIDPELHGAAIQGANALNTIGRPVGMLLAALDLQITEALSLLDQPQVWKKRGLFDEALRRYPEVAPAVDFFTQTYMHKRGWSNTDRQRNTTAFRSKIEMFALDPKLKAIYGQTKPWDLNAVTAQGLTVIRDYRNVSGDAKRQFGFMYDFQSLMSWARYRELRGQPLHIILEELAEYTQVDAKKNKDLFAGDIYYCLNTEARNKNLRFSILLQSLAQVSPQMQRALLSCGNLCLGYQDLESALLLSRALFPYERPREKRREDVFMGSAQGPIKVSERVVEYSIEEGAYLGANAFMRLPGWAYLVRGAIAEGTVAAPLRPMRVTRDVGQWPDKAKIARLRQLLASHSDRPVSDVLAELETRLDIPMTGPDESAIVPEEERYDSQGYRRSYDATATE